MFRTLTLSAAAALIAGSVSAADVNGIFIDLAAQDDDRAAVRALTAVESTGVTFSSKGSDRTAVIFADLAAQDDDRAAVRALSQTSTSGVAFSSKGAAVSPLEVALKHALENDDRQLAAHIAKKLGL